MIRNFLLPLPFLLSAIVAGQIGVAPQDLLQPLKDSWPTYNGDYTGKRYSALTAVDRSTVKHLTLAWMSHLSEGAEAQPPARGGGPFGSYEKPEVIVGGEGPGGISTHDGSVKGSALEVNGILYVTMPDNGWAIDARDGHEIWHYFWKTKGGTHIGNRGFGMWNGYLFMETPDDYLVSLDAKTGKERWHKQIADVDQGYFATPAPIVIGNHVLVGVGDDIDSPGFLQSFDPETGDLQWKHYTVPMEKGDPGPGYLGQPGCGPPRWRADLDHRRLRPGNQSLHLRHGQSYARLHHRHPRRQRQSVYLFPDRAERRHRQDGLVLPDLTA